MENRNAMIEFLSYALDEGEDKVEVLIDKENNTLWATQKAIAELYGCSVPNVHHHINEIINDKELNDSNYKTITLQRLEGARLVNRSTNYYSLKMVLAVGYRVNSKNAIEFRQWANNVLEEYLVKGYKIDNYRLKNGVVFNKDYYDELLEEIRLIRISERRLYQKITDIFMTAIDYDKESDTTLDFFKTVQNKLHYSVSGNTAPEIIRYRADSKKENMGLTTWEKAPEGRIHKSDVVIAKNYLNKDEMEALTRLTTMYLDFAEDMASRNIPLTMKDYVKRLDLLLELSGRDILDNLGKVKREVAEKFALAEYEKYRLIQESKYISDYDKFVLENKVTELPNTYDAEFKALKNLIGKQVEVIVDRPLGSKHPKYKKTKYEVNYGYIKDLYAQDGEYQDAYILGINKPVEVFNGEVIAIIHRLNDVEDKLVVSVPSIEFTDKEIIDLTNFIEKYYEIEIIR